MEEVYMTQKHYMYTRKAKEKHNVKSNQATKFVIVIFFATVSLCFVVVLMLQYKFNFPFHCAILSTKVQQLRNKKHHLEEGDCIWQGGLILATKSSLGGLNLAAISGLGGPFFAAKSGPWTTL